MFSLFFSHEKDLAQFYKTLCDKGTKQINMFSFFFSHEKDLAITKALCNKNKFTMYFLNYDTSNLQFLH